MPFSFCSLYRLIKEQCESCKLSFLGDEMRAKCSLGDNISDSFEKLLQRGRGKVRIYAILVKGEYMQPTTYFLQKIPGSHKE